MYVFFFKQKTAYEMLRSLVGSEMCIRDRLNPNLEEAMKIAVRETIDFITKRFPNLTREEAYTVSYTHLTLPTIYPV